SNSPMSRAPEFESVFALDKRVALPPVTAPAAAAAALVSAAGGSVCKSTVASTLEETGLGETGRGETDWPEGSGLAALEAAETNLLAAAARAAEFTATFGAGVVFLESVAAFLPFSLPFSRPSTSSRAL